MRFPQQRIYFGRYGEVAGRASAGFVIAGAVGFALAAILADLL